MDGLQAQEEGSRGLSQQVPQKEVALAHQQVHPLEEQLADLPPFRKNAHTFLVPGPFGPGLQASLGGAEREVEYEPRVNSIEQGDDGEDEEDDYMQQVMETLRRHPELLEEILQGEVCLIIHSNCIPTTNGKCD